MCGWWKVKKSRKDAEMRKIGAGTGMAREASLLTPQAVAYYQNRRRDQIKKNSQIIDDLLMRLGADVESAN
jgi:hypothetical protein